MKPTKVLRKSVWRYASILLVVFGLSACVGSLEIGIERTATPHQVAPITSVASGTESDQPMTRVAPSPTSVPIPTPVAPLPGMVVRMADGLWQLAATGERERLLERSDALLSPDGTRALYLDKGAGDLDLWLAELSTGERHNLTQTPDRTEGNFVWWPARPDVVLYSSLPQQIAPGPGENGFLTVVDVHNVPQEQGAGYRVLDEQNHTGGLPAPAPDGQTIAYGQGSSGWLYNWETGPQVFDPLDYGLAGTGDITIGSPAWSPDGTRLAWIIGGRFTAGIAFQMGVAVFDLEARTAHVLHLYEPVAGDGWPAAPAWSPDGKWLAFSAWSENRDESGIWVVPVDGQRGDAVHLGGSGPVWSPDGRWLAFRQDAQGGETSHRLAAAGTWTLIQLNLPSDAFLVDWFDVGITHTPTLTPQGPVGSAAEEVVTRTTSSGTATTLSPTPTSVLDGSHLSFRDPMLGLSLDIPFWWETQTTPGAVTRFYQQDHTGAQQAVLSVSVLKSESDTLESALNEVTAGAWGPYIQGVRSTPLGTFNALRVELIPGPDRPPVVWLMVAPSGRAVGIIPDVDPSMIEPLIEVVLDTLYAIPVAAEMVSTPEPPPTPAPAPPPEETGSLSDVREPLLIDGERGWIFASAHVNGQARTVKLATLNGRLLSAYDVSGRLALDRTGGRLFVDQGDAGLAVLDAETGTLQMSVAVPATGPASVDPQVDPTTGRAFVFRDRTIYLIDRAESEVAGAVTLSIPSTACSNPTQDAPITGSYYDLVNRRLYLVFVTYVCTPWVRHTIVSYDADSLTELGRYETESSFHAVPYLDSLYGTTASRLGRNVSWAWNGHELWFEEGFGGAHKLQGIVADWGRQLVYEALNGKVRIFKAYPRAAMGELELASLAGDGRLAGHDPISDQLYFLVDGQLDGLPTDAVLNPPAAETGAETPYCRPGEASIDLSTSDSAPQVGQAVTVTITLANGAASGVRLGQIQYRLGVRPPAAFSSKNWGPIESSLTLEPGHSDAAQFVLQAETPDPAWLTGLASYEIHATDYSWGSWSGCNSWPLEISVTH